MTAARHAGEVDGANNQTIMNNISLINYCWWSCKPTHDPKIWNAALQVSQEQSHDIEDIKDLLQALILSLLNRGGNMRVSIVEPCGTLCYTLAFDCPKTIEDITGLLSNRTGLSVVS